MPATLDCRRLCEEAENLLSHAEWIESEVRRQLTSKHPDPRIARIYAFDLRITAWRLWALALLLTVDANLAIRAAELAHRLLSLSYELEQKATTDTTQRHRHTPDGTRGIVEA